MPIRLISTTFLNRSSGNGPSLLSVLIALPVPAQLIDDAHRTEGLGDVQRGGHGGFVGDVGLGEGGAVTKLGDGLLATDVEDDDLGARVQQSLGRRQPEPGCSTRDDGYGVFDLH